MSVIGRWPIATCGAELLEPLYQYFRHIIGLVWQFHCSSGCNLIGLQINPSHELIPGYMARDATYTISS